MTDKERKHRKSLQDKIRKEKYTSLGLCLRCGKPNDNCIIISSYCSLCRERKRETGKISRKERRNAVIEKYGGSCQCCGESNYRFLTIDHINNDGAIDRKEYGGGSNSAFRRLFNSPIRSDLRLLCYNCNFGRAHNGGVCPHEEKQDDE